MAFAAFNHPLWTRDDARNHVRVPLCESFPVMFRDLWEAARSLFYNTFPTEHVRHVEPMPGATGVLAAGASWLQGVVSNKEGTLLRREVRHTGWDGCFGSVTDARDAPADMPAPAPLLLALHQLGHPPDPSVWCIGDAVLDMQAARAAGVTAALLGDAQHDGGVERAAPDIHVSTSGALVARLHELA